MGCGVLVVVACVCVVVVREARKRKRGIWGVIRKILSSFGTFGQFETIQRRLAWPLH